MLSMTPSNSVLSNRDMGEKSEYWCSFRRVQERKNGFVWACDSRFAWSAAISLSLAPGRYCVNSRTLAKHSAHASRPQSRHIHDEEKIDVIHVSEKVRIRSRLEWEQRRTASRTHVAIARSSNDFRLAEMLLFLFQRWKKCTRNRDLHMINYAYGCMRG